MRNSVTESFRMARKEHLENYCTLSAGNPGYIGVEEAKQTSLEGSEECGVSEGAEWCDHGQTKDS